MLLQVLNRLFSAELVLPLRRQSGQPDCYRKVTGRIEEREREGKCGYAWVGQVVTDEAMKTATEGESGEIFIDCLGS